VKPVATSKRARQGERERCAMPRSQLARWVPSPRPLAECGAGQRPDPTQIAICRWSSTTVTGCLLARFRKLSAVSTNDGAAPRKANLRLIIKFLPSYLANAQAASFSFCGRLTTELVEEIKVESDFVDRRIFVAAGNLERREVFAVGVNVKV
jgi:hypothetical protein